MAVHSTSLARRCISMRSRGAVGARASSGGSAASGDARCEVFTHPAWGRALRVRVAVPQHTWLLEESPLLYCNVPARLDAVCDEAVEALKCMRSVPERMLAFATAPEDVRRQVLDMYCGGGPEAWPRALPNTDILNDQMVYSSDNTLLVALGVAAWLSERVPEAAAAGGADALARAAAAFSFNAIGVQANGKDVVSALYAHNSKIAHACGWAANCTFQRPAGGVRGSMLTLAPLAAGAPLLFDYVSGREFHTTPVRRHFMRRSKMFDCLCEACTSPDELAALPCPACVPRDPTGLVPLSLVMGKARALKKHPLVVPDGINEDDPAAPPAWRCDTCSGVFSSERMAAIQIGAGVTRPLPRTSSFRPGSEPAGLLDLARWAEAAVFQMMLELPHSNVSDSPEGRADLLMSYIVRLVPIVGTAHSSVLRLQAEHLKTLHKVAVDLSSGTLPTPKSIARRLSGRVPLLDSQLPALLRLPANEYVPPEELAIGIMAGTLSMWPRLGAAGLLRPTCTNTQPSELISFTVQLVHCLGMESDPKIAGPLLAMLRELPPSVNYGESVRMVVRMSFQMLQGGLSR